MIVFPFNPVLTKVSFSKSGIFFTTFFMPQVDFDVKYSDADAIISILFCNSPKFTEPFTKDRLDCIGTLRFPLRHTTINVCNNRSILDEKEHGFGEINHIVTQLSYEKSVLPKVKQPMLEARANPQ